MYYYVCMQRYNNDDDEANFMRMFYWFKYLHIFPELLKMFSIT